MGNLTFEAFLAKLAETDLLSGHRMGHLTLQDRSQVLAERQDIQTMRCKLDRNRPDSWIPWIVENRRLFQSERFQAITAQGILNAIGPAPDSTRLAA